MMMGQQDVGDVARPVNFGKWHMASDYQGVVDEVKKAFPDYIESMDTLVKSKNKHIQR